MSTPTDSKAAASTAKADPSAKADSGSSPDDAKADTKFPEGYPRGRTAKEVPAIDGPEFARGTVEQTSPAAHVDDVAYVAALLKGDSRAPNRDKAVKEAEVLGVNYQYAGQVRQLLAERANVIAYGNTDRLAGIETALDALGYSGDRSIGASSDSGPAGRSSRADKTLRSDAPTTGDDSKAAGSKSAAKSTGGTTGTSPAGTSTTGISTTGTGTGTTSATSPTGGTAASSKQS
jgi:hypothetical protein